MNNLIFFSVVFVSTLGVIAGQNFKCPFSDGLFPNPADCNSYIQCSNGRDYIKQCPGGLQWNDRISECDWPSSSTCNSAANPNRPTIPPPPGFVCSRVDIATTKCMGPKDCLYPNPNNCNTFIQCVPQPNGSGKPVVMPCAANLEWNDNKKECDWPQNSTCPGRITTTTPRPRPPTTTTTTTTSKPTPGFRCPRDDIANTGCMGPKDCLYPNPANCNSFIQCVPQPDGSGKPQVMPCPAGLEWNDNEKICDWPQSSTCPGRITTTTPRPRPSTTTTTTTTPKPTPGFRCPRDDIANTGCMGPKDCLYPNPANCNSFIQCVPQPDGSGKPQVMPCPAGLEWNDNEKICDWPQSSTCPGRITTTTPRPRPSTTTTTTTTPKPTPGFRCPRDDIANTGCMGPKDCLYPNPANCNSFIQCVPQPDGSGKPQVMPCPAGLEWNDNEKICDWPQSSTCPGRITTTTPRPRPSTTTTTTTTPKPTPGFRCPRDDIANTGCMGPKDCLYPNPANCNSFIQCVPQPDGSGKPQVMPCPAGLEWNDNEKICDWPQSSTCPGRITTTTPRPRPSTTTTTTTTPKPTPGFRCPRDDIANTGCMGPKDCLYPNPANCNSFIQCVPQPDGSGKPQVMPCPAGLEWNDNEKICDWPQSSTCPGRITTPRPRPSTTTTTTTTPKPTPGFRCPRDDIANTGCMGPKDCLYPNPANCNSFIQCVPQPDGSGKPQVMPCPAGLEWNDNEKICDWPQSSTCPGRITTTTRRPRPPTTTTTTTTPRPRPSTTTTTTTTPKPTPGFQCPRDDIANTGCMGPKDCLYPNPANCNSFIQCVPQPDGSGKPQVMPCPAGLEWNDNEKICDWPQSSTCPNKPTNAPTAAPTQKPTDAPTAAPTQAPTNPPTAAPTQAPTNPPTEPPTNPPTEPPTDKPTTTEAPVETTTPVCGEDPNQDNNLDLLSLCSGCWEKHLVANPNSQERYVECNGGPNNDENTVKKCSPGLLFDKDKLTCDYQGLVNGY